MELNKLEQSLLNLVRNFLIDDYSSWQILELSNSKRKKSKHDKKKSENSQSEKGRNMGFDTHARAWVKSFVWRIFGIVILGTVSWVVTHSWKEMTVITFIFHGVRVILYYFHERVWERIHWGRIKHPLSILPVNRELEPEDLILIQSQLRELGYLD